MSTNRKTTKQLVPVNYFDESSSEDESDDKKTKAAKIKLKELNNDSDQESNKPITKSDSEDSEDYDDGVGDEEGDVADGELNKWTPWRRS